MKWQTHLKQFAFICYTRGKEWGRDRLGPEMCTAFFFCAIAEELRLGHLRQTETDWLAVLEFGKPSVQELTSDEGLVRQHQMTQWTATGSGRAATGTLLRCRQPQAKGEPSDPGSPPKTVAKAAKFQRNSGGNKHLEHSSTFYT